MITQSTCIRIVQSVSTVAGGVSDHFPKSTGCRGIGSPLTAVRGNGNSGTGTRPFGAGVGKKLAILSLGKEAWGMTEQTREEGTERPRTETLLKAHVCESLSPCSPPQVSPENRMPSLGEVLKRWGRLHRAGGAGEVSI